MSLNNKEILQFGGSFVVGKILYHLESRREKRVSK